MSKAGKPLVVIGEGGQLARALKKLQPDAVILGRGKADLAYPERLMQVLQEYDARAVINAASYNFVDKAETEEALATAINGESPRLMAEHCARKQIPFVHVSTDYVMDGGGTAPWKETDTPAPLSAYGRSKLEGERGVAEAGGNYLIFRTSWLYDAEGRNFFNTILRLAGEREELSVVDDQCGAPTYVPMLAAAIVQGLNAAVDKPSFPSGLYHLCQAGVTSWYGFASAIVEEAKHAQMKLTLHTLKPIPSSDYPLPAKRPANSRLDCAKALSMLGISLPHWREGLAACMELKREGR